MTPNRKVIDISHWNTVTDWAAVKAAGIVGVIAKATEGTGYVDDCYLSNARGALGAGLLFGGYHFANASDPHQQVDHFLAVTGIDNDELLALDWEDDPNGGTMSLAQAREFISYLDAKIGSNRTVIYSGNTAKQALGS